MKIDVEAIPINPIFEVVHDFFATTEEISVTYYKCKSRSIYCNKYCKLFVPNVLFDNVRRYMSIPDHYTTHYRIATAENTVDACHGHI